MRFQTFAHLTTQGQCYNNNMIAENSKAIIQEISLVFAKSEFSSQQEFASAVISANKIVCAGAGRMGFALRGFSMRLAHLGKQAFMLGDTNVPHTSSGDLVIIGSGSGETQTIYDLAQTAKTHGATIATITGNPESRIGKLSDIKLIMKAPSATRAIEGLRSVQPMTSLNEQCLAILLDSIVLDLMFAMNETHDTMWRRHSNLE